MMGRPSRTEAIEFVAFLMEDANCVTAEVGTPRDMDLKEYEAQGLIKFHERFADTNSYVILGSPVLRALGGAEEPRHD